MGILKRHSPPANPSFVPTSTTESITGVIKSYQKGEPVTIGKVTPIEKPEPIEPVAPVLEEASHTSAQRAENTAAPTPQAPPETILLEKRAAIEREVESYRIQLYSQIEEEKKRTLTEAHREGLEQGKREGERRLKAQAEDLLQTINGLATEKKKILENAKSEVLNVALKVASQIIKSEISFNQAVCMNIVSEALSKVTEKDQVIIRLNKADADYMNTQKDRLHALLGDIKNLTIQEDSKIEQGGCIIETKMGYIDATIETKLESIRQALMDTVEEEAFEAQSPMSDTYDAN